MLSINRLARWKNVNSLASTARRTFAITIPHKKLNFIDHEVHGKVYPIVSYNKASVKPRRKILTLSALSVGNSLAFYSLFVDPILQTTILASLCAPQFLVPSMIFNYFYMGEYSVMYKAKRDMVINMWLLPNGKQILVETYNGDTRKVNIKDFYNFEQKDTRFGLGSRIEMYHGANNYLFLTGNPHYIDHEVLNSVTNKNFVDTKNVTFDVDMDKSFTWEIDKLMRSNLMQKHKKQILRLKFPLTEEEKSDKVKKLLAVNKIRKRVKSINFGRKLGTNFYGKMKVYEGTRKWANFKTSELQGSLIKFGEELEGVKLYEKAKVRGDKETQSNIKKNEEQEQRYLNLRQKLLRRRAVA